MGMQTLLLDINVWLDYYFPGRPGHRAAFCLVDRAIALDCDLVIASGSLSDFFYIACAVLKRESRVGQGSAENGPAGVGAGALPSDEACKEAAWKMTEHVLETAGVVGSDYSDAWLALKYRCIHNDLEDDLVIAASQRGKADYLITSDADLLKHSPVAALCPADWLALNDTASRH